MKKKLITYTINTFEEAKTIILESRNYQNKPILHLKKYILSGFGPEFILTFKNILTSSFGKSSFKLFVDCGFDQGLAINMISNNIEYVKFNGNHIILSKIKNIAKKNRVLLNPNFNIVDCRNRKNIKLKLEKLNS